MVKLKLKRHPDRLGPSDEDMVALCATVVTNYNAMLKSHRRIKGTDLLIPTHMEAARVLVCKLAHRYEGDDFRHNESEKKALREFASWTLFINHDLRGQDGPPPTIDWVD